MAVDIKSAVRALEPELIDLRRAFHRHPELGFEEVKSQARIMDYLGALDIPAEKTGGTGVVAWIRGREPGRTILLRSDMDALPVQEETGLGFASAETGKMHACGHDGHMAMLLVAAKVLASMRDRIKGCVKLVFQPNEEAAGAYKMIESGVMENPRVDAVFGIHLWSQVPVGEVDIVTGPQMAASHYFTLRIHGSGGHAGFAHESVDPIYTATQVVQAVQGIQTRQVDALNPLVIMFTKIQGGANTTIIPETVEMQGSVRFLYEGGEAVFDRFRRVVDHTCKAFGAEFDLTFSTGNHLLVNDETVSGIVRQAAEETLGDASKVTARIRTMAGEDFSDYLASAPGAFAFVGIRNPDVGAAYPHHHPKFTIDEDALAIGAELHVRTALRLLDDE